MTIKKLFALSLAGIMVFSMPVFAAPSPTVATALTEEEISAKGDHVVVDMTSLGTLAFIEVPAK